MRFVRTCMMAGLVAMLQSVTFSQESVKEPELMFREFAGICQAPVVEEKYRTAIGWERMDFFWHELEHEGPGIWDEERWQTLLAEARAKVESGIKILPVLAYGTGFNYEMPYEYELGNRKIAYSRTNDNRFLRRIFVKSGDNWTQVSEDTLPHVTAPLAPDKIHEWERYVEKMVSTLGAPPYNVEYFQIWNEACPSSGFWDADMTRYAERIHRPAAAIIRKHGKKVVYGGWACCHAPSEYIRFMDEQKLWDQVDVMDIHYFNLHDMQYVRRESEKRGYNYPSWQTEAGFCQDYFYIPRAFPEAFDWALQVKPFDPEAVKMFYFAYRGTSKPGQWGYGHMLENGSEGPSPHGMAMMNLGELLGTEPVRSFRNYQVSEWKPEQGKHAGFAVGDQKIVLWFWFREPKSIDPAGFLTVQLPGTFPGEWKAVRGGAFGERTPLEISRTSEALSVRFPVAETPEKMYTDRFVKVPEAGIRPVGFLELTQVR